MGREERKLMGSAVLNLAAPVENMLCRVSSNTSCLPDIHKLKIQCSLEGLVAKLP